MVVYGHCEQDKRRRSFVVDEDTFFGREICVLDETLVCFSRGEGNGMIVGGGNKNGDWTYWSRKFRRKTSWYKRNGESDWNNDDGGGGG